MPVKLTFRDQEFEVKEGMNVISAIESIGMNSEAVLPTRDGELVNDDEILRDGEVIKLVAVISGG